MPTRSLDDSELPGRKKLASKLVRKLKAAWPDAECALTHRNPYELTVAVILSAQCTDALVNKVTPGLFKQYPTPEKLAKGQTKSIEKRIGAVNYYKTKAKNIRAMAKAVVDDHGGEIPNTVEGLTSLPGIGKKTANVILGVGFGIASGVVVDTHVKRLTHRFGLTHSDKPEVVELDLIELLPKQEWIDWSHRVILHGRSICPARKPKCDECTLAGTCEQVGISR